MATKEELRTSMLAREDIVDVEQVAGWTKTGMLNGEKPITWYDVPYEAKGTNLPIIGRVRVEHDNNVGGTESAKTVKNPDEPPSFSEQCIAYLNSLPRTELVEEGANGYFSYRLDGAQDRTGTAQATYIKNAAGDTKIAEAWELRADDMTQVKSSGAIAITARKLSVA